ncbi:MAG: PEP-utilizing enzyme [Candidatus Woesearchaeota archaeon]
MENIDWLWTMKKPQVPLAQHLHVIAFPIMRKNLGIDVDLPTKHVDGDIYFGEEALKKIEKHIEEKISKDSSYADLLLKKIDDSVYDVRKVSKELDSKDINNLTLPELLSEFKNAYITIGHLTSFMSFKGTVQISDVFQKKVRGMLSNKISDFEERENIFLTLSMPIKESMMTKEQNSIARIAAEKDIDKKEKMLDKHTKEFSWLGIVMYQGLPFNKEHFRKELKNVTKGSKNKEGKIKECAYKLKLNEDEAHLIKQLRVWVHIRTYIKDMTSLGIASTVRFLQEISKRVDVPYNDLIYLYFSELYQIKDGKEKEKLVEKIKKRQKSWGYVISQDKLIDYDMDNIDEIKENELKIPSGVKGYPAFKGRVKGRAVVVKSELDLERVKEGDILITHMTTTNFVPILSKVSAIVTDEGGITCHAAIVSRELGIPCVIGTRMATKAFKDDEIVEVDAEKGIIRKIV